MKRNVFILGVFAATLLVNGCAYRARHSAGKSSTLSSNTPAILPAEPEPGKITQINAKYRYVVIDFGRRMLPPMNSQLVVYRHNQRVATVRLTPLSRGRFGTADILEGDPCVGDEIRTN